MPFYYYGSKSKIARYYPAPRYNTIIEPFAGAAAYSLHWATPDTRVILIEKNEYVAALWRRIQKMSVDELNAIECPPKGERTSEPLLIAVQGGTGGGAAWTRGRDCQVTGRMASDWRQIIKRVIKYHDLIQNWEIIEGNAGLVAPDIEATWFIDPPYWVQPDRLRGNGAGYREGASAINFKALGNWCRSRKGQVIVCEQKDAPWLPFTDLTNIVSANGKRRSTEVIWTNDPSD